MRSGSSGSHAGPRSCAPAATPSAPSTSTGVPFRCGAATAYSAIPSWGPAVIEAARLEEVRSTAEEELAAAHLDCGEHHSVIASAEALVREQPLRERRWSLLATALYRSGRQADSLAALRAARVRFAEELGIEPGPELAALEGAILHHDPSLVPPPRGPQPSADCPYKGLRPYGVEDGEVFFGRDADIAAVLARLDRAPFIAVSGPSGCGKSSLVLAGVVPALARRGLSVRVVSPTNAIAEQLRDALYGPTQRRRRGRRPARGALPRRVPGR